MDQEKQLQDLNDDCLLAIFQNLPVIDYWHLRKVCRRFDQLITNAYCPSNYKHWSDINTDNDTELDDFELLSLEKFKSLLNHMSDVVEELELQMFSENHMKLLQRNRNVLSAVRTLKVRLTSFNNRNADNLDVATILGKAFPNVETLIFEGSLSDTTGFTEMVKLKNIELYCADTFNNTIENLFIVLERCSLNAITIQCFAANRRLIKEFCEGIKKCANTCTEIAVSSDFLALCIRAVYESSMLFQNLHRFAYVDVELLEGEEGCFSNNLLGPIAERIYRFGSNFDYIPFPIDVLSDLLNLEQLIISDSGVTCRKLKRLTEYFPRLNEIQCWNKNTFFEEYCEDEDEEDTGEATALNTLTFLTSFNENLKILAVPVEWIGERFSLQELMSILEKQANRKTRLEFRCLVQKKITANERKEILQNFQTYEHPDLLKISLQEFPNDWLHWDSVTRHYFDFYLKPMSSKHIN